jgi:putative SOS response-associated peptidase YedK
LPIKNQQRVPNKFNLSPTQNFKIMCVKLRGSKMTPGQIAAFLTKVGKVSGVWGFQDGRQYNARWESLFTIWKKMEWGILEADCFWEKSKRIVRVDRQPFQLGVIYNPQMEFSVITVPAQGVVKPIHHRMPLCVADANLFFKGLVTTISPDLLKIHSEEAIPVGNVIHLVA